MVVREVENLELIKKIHKEMYTNEFPMESMISKEKRGYNMLKYEFWDEDKIVGYCVVTDKEREKNLHAWVGGTIPTYQGKGYFSQFYDWLIELGHKKKYETITGNTDNYKFNMIRMMVKKGFYITSVDKTEYGDGVKIHLRYDIHEPRSIRLSLTTACNLNCFFCHHEGIQENKIQNISIPEIERILTQARRINISEITLTGGEPFLEPDKIAYILRYCSSWDKPPLIKIVTNGTLITKEIIEKLRYKGELHINLSIHSGDPDNICKIVGKEVKLEKYKDLISELNKKGIPVRINSTVVKGINDSIDEMRSLIEFALKTKVSGINFMELLVTKEQKGFHKYYISNEEIENNLKKSIEMWNHKLIKKNSKKTTYEINIDGFTLNSSVYRLSCRCGCRNCIKNNDITISSTGKGHPCYLEPEISIGNALENLESLIEQCDDFIEKRENSFSQNLLYWGE